MNFGNHPDPAIDFCIEVDGIEGLAADYRAGLEARQSVEDRIFKAMQFRVGGDEKAVAAKAHLRKIEGQLLGNS